MDWAAMVEDARKTPQLQTVGKGNQLLTRSLCESERPCGRCGVGVDVDKGVKKEDVDGAMEMDGQVSLGLAWPFQSSHFGHNAIPESGQDKSKQELHRRCPPEAPKNISNKDIGKEKKKK
ncbi:hypothetical protein ASPBRDRAFT_76440 [Aspergillus brasiliensis CBS 101740]|uniref:Uncharacterized protein n=1 Tax=Aspergillus brasiliensis (strain CBS 101740 / IMI 381727 / IBT 21946) TaxID=767769 RepID=A0A1L9UGH6_ASPBC|nr:hypothetical protein ASPBRDRAFT_76440 [Aspergillus brasiliensis CBS 101740]